MNTEKNDPIKERLEEIATANGGRLTPAAVIDDAKKKDSPLHGEFEWDVKKAAYAHWTQTARKLITSVMVVTHTETTSVRSVYYVRDPSAASKDQGYVSVTTLRSDADLAREALINEFTAVADRLRRARDLALALDAQDDVENLIQSVVGLRQKYGGDSAVQ